VLDWKYQNNSMHQVEVRDGAKYSLMDISVSSGIPVGNSPLGIRWYIVLVALGVTSQAHLFIRRCLFHASEEVPSNHYSYRRIPNKSLPEEKYK
jgi:hypothetical protein